MIYLYIKTHNKTGLKYLGKTKQNPYEYKGSGVYWKKHLKMHGNDVTTQVIFQSTDIEDIRRKGLELSEKYDIVQSDEWANLIEENGIGGVTKTSFKSGAIPWNKGVKDPKQSKVKRKYWEEWRKNNPNYKEKWKCNNRVKTGYDSEARRYRAIERNKIQSKCPHCGKEGQRINMLRWHFDNCKVK